MQIKTLRLATSYIDYLINVLKSDDPNSGAEGFKADIHKKWNEKTEEQKRKELVSASKLQKSDFSSFKEILTKLLSNTSLSCHRQIEMQKKCTWQWL